MTKYADVCVQLTVSFEDNGNLDLKTQAIEAAMNKLGILCYFNVDGIDVIGEVRETEDPVNEAT